MSVCLKRYTCEYTQNVNVKKSPGYYLFKITTTKGFHAWKRALTRITLPEVCIKVFQPGTELKMRSPWYWRSGEGRYALQYCYNFIITLTFPSLVHLSNLALSYFIGYKVMSAPLHILECSLSIWSGMTVFPVALLKSSNSFSSILRTDGKTMWCVHPRFSIIHMKEG